MSDTTSMIEESAEVTATAEANELGEYRSLRGDVWRQFRRHTGALVGLGLLATVIILTLVGPYIWPWDPYAIDTPNKNLGASWSHPMGTDNLGRDVVARVLVGGRVSLGVGVAAMLVLVFIGTAIGIMAGFFKRLDGLLMRFTDLVLAIPLLPLLLVIVSLFRDKLKDALGANLGVFVLLVTVIGCTSWMPTARVVRGDVLAIKQEEFVLAARSIGTRRFKTVIRHILPNVLSPVMVAASLGVATAIISESALSFLGFGFPADFPTWGRLLYDGKDYLRINPYRVIAPGLMISMTVLSVNFIGDGLRDALDPKLRSKG